MVSDYSDDKELRESFNSLAIRTFELDFKDWYERGYWNEKYIPYSFLDSGEVIANASVNKMSIIINGDKYRAIQIGTVMTDHKYRNQGLASELIEKIIDEYKDQVDFIYLFANEMVLDFYPKFGFERRRESEYSLDLGLSDINSNGKAMRRLNLLEDLEIIEKFALNRRPNSRVLGVEENENLLMFYFILVFSENIYYIDELNILLLMEEDGSRIHLYDIISLKSKDFDIKSVLEYIIGEGKSEIIFYFTPDFKLNGLREEKIDRDDDALFILSDKQILEGNFMFPITSHC